MAVKLDPLLRNIIKEFLATSTNKRARLAVKILLEKGEVTTDDLAAAGYVHTPRVIGDVRDAGIPIVTSQGTSINGKRQAVYRFGSPDDIQEGRINGRVAIPKPFRVCFGLQQ